MGKGEIWRGGLEGRREDVGEPEGQRPTSNWPAGVFRLLLHCRMRTIELPQEPTVLVRVFACRQDRTDRQDLEPVETACGTQRGGTPRRSRRNGPVSLSLPDLCANAWVMRGARAYYEPRGFWRRAAATRTTVRGRRGVDCITGHMVFGSGRMVN